MGWYVYRPVKIRKDKDNRKRKRRSKYYSARLKIQGRTIEQLPLKLSDGRGITDKEVAETALRELITRREREAVGLVDPLVESAGRPIEKVVADYLRHMRRQGFGRQHIWQALRNLRFILEQGELKRLADFNADRIEKALGVLVARKRSPRTINIYRAHAHALAEWAIAIPKILAKNPVADVPVRDERVDVRRRRRAMTQEEAAEFLRVAKKRCLAYACWALTGLRVNELRTLEWRDLYLDGQAPYIQLRAEATKAGRADEVDLNAELAAELKKAKPASAKPTDRVFKSVPTLNTFKRDLIAAGIPFKDDQGRQLDRHALRTTFVSWLGVAGVDVRVAQHLARHTDIKLTTQTYQDVKLLRAMNAQAAVAKLPSIIPQANAKSEALKTAGSGGSGQTSSACTSPPASGNPEEGAGAPRGAPKTFTGVHPESSGGTPALQEEARSAKRTRIPKSRKKSTLSTENHPVSPTCTSMPGTGIEPARPFGHMPLKHARLPIPPPGQASCINTKKSDR